MTLIPFDNRDGHIWLDGAMVPWRDAKVHVLTHGLHYASSIFEGERAYGGRIFRLRTHTERLFNSARLLGFEIPYTADEIDAACDAVVAANGLSDAYVRPVAWRGSEQMQVAAPQSRVHVAIAAWAWPNIFGADRMKGVRLGIARWKRPHPETAPTASKAAGLYMIGTLAKHEAAGEGYDDAMMLDWRGHVAEGTGANMFLVMDGELHTPTPDCFLDGITRRSVIALAKRRQIKLIERTIMPDELPRATEVFLTGTAAEVTPVRQIGPHSYTPGRITETLVADYERLVRMTGAEVDQQMAA
ncbi:MAG TPA: branched-chain amino acid aminotransferase [Acetobacteraceae bacterium]|jgi:branched-chain amino acid aminotransferase|nr:branched-chain amino acid aminotransferase [Acetobacteraceae bacterium]